MNWWPNFDSFHHKENLMNLRAQLEAIPPMQPPPIDRAALPPAKLRALGALPPIEDDSEHTTPLCLRYTAAEQRLISDAASLLAGALNAQAEAEAALGHALMLKRWRCPIGSCNRRRCVTR
jgi:hypothetical protein